MQFSQDALFEAKVDQLCNIILVTESEFWETKNKAVNQLTRLFAANYTAHSIDDSSSSELADVESLSSGSSCHSVDFMFTPEIFRLLKEPIKSLISDLRSQQVRDACLLLSKIATCGGDRSSLRLFLRDSFGFILEGVKVPHKVMSGFVHECILSMIRSVPFKTALTVLCTEVRENKAKLVRERCLEYLNVVILHWEINDKEVDMIGEAILHGLEDAAVNGREIARTAYVNLHGIWPKKAEKLKNTLSSKSLKSKLDKAIENREKPLLTPQQQSAQKQPLRSKEPVSRTVPRQKTIGSNTMPSSATKPLPTPVKTPRQISTRSNNLLSKSLDNVGSSSSSSLLETLQHSKPITRTAKGLTTSSAFSHSAAAKWTSASDHAAPRTPRHAHSATILAVPKLSASRPGAAESLSHSPGNNHSMKVVNGDEKAVTSIQATMRGSMQRRRNSVIRNPFEQVLSSHAATAPLNDPNPSQSSLTAAMGVDEQDHEKDRWLEEECVKENAGENENEKEEEEEEEREDLIEQVEQGNPQEREKAALSEGVEVLITYSKKWLRGQVRFVGSTHFADGVWIGVELQDPVGKNDGSVDAISYFHCPSLHGLFIREKSVLEIIDTDAVPSSSTFVKTSLSHNIGSDEGGVVSRNAEVDGSSGSIDGDTDTSSRGGDTDTMTAALTLQNSQDICGMLKRKLDQLMDSLNRQLEIVVSLEQEEQQLLTIEREGGASDPEALQAEAVDLRRQILAITDRELDLLGDFKERILQSLHRNQ